MEMRIYSMVGLENLQSKCPIEVDSENKKKMHDHIRDMGRIIVSQGSMPRHLSHIDDFLDQTSSASVSFLPSFLFGS